MVSNDSRNNLIILIMVVAVGVLVLYFMFSFSETMKQASDYSGKVVNQTATNVTATFKQVVSLITKQLALQEEERTRDTENLELFFETFANQSADELEAIHEMKDHFGNVTNDQTDVFVETLTKSQNLTGSLIDVLQENNTIVTGNLTPYLNQSIISP